MPTHDRNRFEARLERVRAAMVRAGFDLLVVGYGPDFTYLTGLTEPLYYTILKIPGDWVTSLLVSLDRPPLLLAHPYFAINLEPLPWLNDIRLLPEGHDPGQFVAATLADYSPSARSVGIGKLLWSETLLGLQAALSGARFTPATTTLMDDVRAVKDPDEIELMKEAARVTDLAFGATVERLHAGMTERDVAIEVEYQIKRHGGDGYSFEPGIICVGPGSPPDRHIFTRNTGTRLEPGSTVAFDFGVRYRGYCSDFGRSVFIGEPSPVALAAYRAIASGITSTLGQLAEGRTSPAGLCEFFGDLMGRAGFREHYLYHGLGHSIGLDVHEEPWILPRYTDPIRERMCFTIEPKIWQPGEFYVRCEDVVVVGIERGDPLTHYSHDPIVIG